MEAGAAIFMMFRDNYAGLNAKEGHMIQTIVRSLGGLLLLVFLVPEVRAKEWRGIVPLKSTKADVERLLGKPNRLGRYEIGNERVSVLYSEGPCDGESQALPKDNCECLVAKDTVVRIALTLDSPVSVAKLGLDKAKYRRTPFLAYHPSSTYSDFSDGVVYTVRESDDSVTSIDYLPSTKDCEMVIKGRAPTTASNVWHGIVPLRSTRADVERLLGPATFSFGDTYSYSTTENRVDALYLDDPCKPQGSSQGTPPDYVAKLTVTPKRILLVSNLQLDKNKFIRVRNDHPENWVHYLSSELGITIDAIVNGGCEEVKSIVYQATSKDRELRCRTNAKTPGRKSECGRSGYERPISATRCFLAGAISDTDIVHAPPSDLMLRC